MVFRHPAPEGLREFQAGGTRNVPADNTPQRPLEQPRVSIPWRQAPGELSETEAAAPTGNRMLTV